MKTTAYRLNSKHRAEAVVKSMAFYDASIGGCRPSHGAVI